MHLRGQDLSMQMHFKLLVTLQFCQQTEKSSNYEIGVMLNKCPEEKSLDRSKDFLMISQIGASSN